MNQKYVTSQIVYKNIQSILTTALTFLLPMIFYWIDKTLNESDEVCGWVNEKHGMSWIIQKIIFGLGVKCS